MRSFAISFTTSILLLPSSGAAAQDWRLELGAERVRAIELIVQIVSPEGTLGWEGDVVLRLPHGGRKLLRLPGFVQLPNTTGQLIVTAVEYPEDASDALKRLRVFDTVAALTAPTRVVLAKVSTDGRVQRSQNMLLDAAAIISECRSIQLAGQRHADEWPQLRVSYRSWHSDTDVIGSVDWVALVDAELQRVIARTPTAFWRKTRDGIETADLLRGTELPTGIELHGVRTDFRRTVQCAAPCRIEPMAVLRSAP